MVIERLLLVLMLILFDVVVAEVIGVLSNMSNNKSVKGLKKSSGCWNNSSIMQCFSSKDQMRVDEILKLSDSFDDVQPRPDTVNIEEAESSLREGGGLNYEVCFSCVLL